MSVAVLEVDHVEGLLERLENNDAAYALVARAPLDGIAAVRKRLGWRSNCVSSYGSDFNDGFNVSSAPDAMVAGRAFYPNGAQCSNQSPEGLGWW